MLFSAIVLGAPAKPTHDIKPVGPMELSATQVAMYKYWSGRAENGENDVGMAKFTPVLPKNHKAVSLVTYDLPAYLSPGEPCLPWCHVEVEVDAAAAAAAGRVTFPPENLATWSEKCSWDKYCSGCTECALSVCDPMCETLKDPTQSPIWKKKNWDGAKLCGWGICHSCSWCGIAPPPPPVSPYVPPPTSPPGPAPPAPPPPPPPCYDQAYTTTATEFDICSCTDATGTNNTCIGDLGYHDGAESDCERHTDYAACGEQKNFWGNTFCTGRSKTVVTYFSRRRTEPTEGGDPC